MNKVAILALAAIPLMLTGCTANASSTTGSAATLNYGLWDANQLPAYTQCATDFHAANPDITVNVEQLGWDDYWKKINTGFVSGENYDVFTSHLANFPEFALNSQILPLDDYIKADGVDINAYQPGLADLWKGKDGKQYGLPKDFDTIAMFYNKQAHRHGRPDRRPARLPHLEPHRRRHVREGHRAPDGRQERCSRR
ncbi:ABC transporter substrate-binding protein [Cryobacterium breve]|uniref:ABC transporter substrate-binding protein n=1 Tax=Cryobacterium breve TaxID=1259258 RepID=UPI0032B267FE